MSESDSIRHLQQLMARGGGAAFEAVPLALANVIKEKQWRDHTDQDGKLFESFEAFVAYKLWWGLESSIPDLLAFCRKREDVQSLIRGEVGESPEHVGRGHRTDNISPNSYGTDPTYTLRRLKRDRPDLAELVVAGTMSANAAAIEAGFRHKSTPLQSVQSAWRKATTEEREAIAAWIDEQMSALTNSRFVA